MSSSAMTTAAATNVTVNGSTADRYADNTFALGGFSLADGTNTFTAVAADSLGRRDTNTVSVNLPATVSFSYDANGNLSGDGRRIFAYDDENQLISVIVTNGSGSSTKSEFAYDGRMRRRVRKEFNLASGAWALASETRYVYDSAVVLQERDGNNLPRGIYTRGCDLSGRFQGSGGIGGLLARTDQCSDQSAFYHADGNGNITALVNGQQAVVGRYTYDPFGNTPSVSGPLAAANLYRFSSKEFHPTSGLYAFGFRFYDPNLQRWLTPDPLGEATSPNLYGFVRNIVTGWIDPLGLDEKPPKDGSGLLPGQPKPPSAGDALKGVKDLLDAPKSQDLLTPGPSGDGASLFGVPIHEIPQNLVETWNSLGPAQKATVGLGVGAAATGGLYAQYQLTGETELDIGGLGVVPKIPLGDGVNLLIDPSLGLDHGQLWGEFGLGLSGLLSKNPVLAAALDMTAKVEEEGAYHVKLTIKKPLGQGWLLKLGCETKSGDTGKNEGVGFFVIEKPL